MPELPEVETMRRCVSSATGARIVAVRRPRSRLQSITFQPAWGRFRKLANGRTILAVRRLGKRVVLDLDNERSIVIEPRMSGLVLLADPPNRTHLRVIFELAGGAARQLLFWDQRGLGVVQLLSAAEMERRLGPDALGPDALSITAAELRTRLSHCRRPIKVALLDQKLVAGVGNLYASEILHRARIHPATPCAALAARDWARVHAALRCVLLAAIAHQGSTLRDGTYRIARDAPGNFQACHRVYQRHGKACVQCAKGEIVRIVQAQRSTFFCPHCQRPQRGQPGTT